MIKRKVIIILCCLFSLNAFAGEVAPVNGLGCRATSPAVTGKIFQVKIGETSSSGGSVANIYGLDDYVVTANNSCMTWAPIGKACNIPISGSPGSYYIGSEVTVDVVNCPIDAGIPVFGAVLIFFAVRALKRKEKTVNNSGTTHLD